MPIYEYLCGKCGHEFEVIKLSSSAFKGTKCPECGSSKIGRKFSTFAPSVSGSRAVRCGDKSACNIPSTPCDSGMCGLS